MERIAKFSKVSFEQYLNDFKNLFPYTALSDDEIHAEYDDIKLPIRSTSGSAGYDFFAPHSLSLEPYRNTFFPSGIRCEIEDGWVLQLYPKSGLGVNFGTRLLNTVGIIDGDYAFSQNEGHILIGLSAREPLYLESGSKYIQGIFVPYGITVDDEATGKRDGGFGSTGVR